MEYNSILRSNFSRNEYKRYISFERQSLGRFELELYCQYAFGLRLQSSIELHNTL